MAQRTAIVSAKGGVGKSSLAAGLSRTLALRGRRVLLVDTDIGIRSVDIMLGVAQSTVYGWDDVLGGVSPEKAFVNAVNGVKLLCAPMRDADYPADGFCALLDSIDDRFDYIILDSPAGFDGGFKLCAAASSSAIIVATPDEVSLRAASLAADRLRRDKPTQLRLVINRWTKRGVTQTLDGCVDSVCARLVGVVPEDKAVLACSAGKPLSERSAAFAAYKRIAARIEGESIPLGIY